MISGTCTLLLLIERKNLDRSHSTSGWSVTASFRENAMILTDFEIGSTEVGRTCQCQSTPGAST